MSATPMILTPDVMDPLSVHLNEYHANARREIMNFKQKCNCLVQGDVYTQSRVLRLLLGPRLAFSSLNMLDSSAAWIAAIQCCHRLGMIGSVCKQLSVDGRLRRMDKEGEDLKGVVVVQMKGKGCDGEEAVGICFPEDTDSCILPKCMIAPSKLIVQIDDVLRKGSFGCNCKVAGEEEGVTRVSLVTNGMCMKSEIIKGEVKLFSLGNQEKKGGGVGVGLVATKTMMGMKTYTRINSLDDLRKELICQLWNESGMVGERLKFAICHEFARLEKTVSTWRTLTGEGNKFKRQKATDRSYSPMISVHQSIHGPTSFLLRVPEGSDQHLEVLATKKLLVDNTNKIMTLVPSESFYSHFLDDLNSYFEWLDMRRRANGLV